MVLAIVRPGPRRSSEPRVNDLQYVQLCDKLIRTVRLGGDIGRYYEYRFTEYEYDEDRNALMPERLGSEDGGRDACHRSRP
jgi:hypothetical protein